MSYSYNRNISLRSLEPEIGSGNQLQDGRRRTGERFVRWQRWLW
jgi:hypothetical protein